MSDVLGSAVQWVSAHVRDRAQGWRTGSRSSQVYVLCVLLTAATVSLVPAWLAFDATPSALWVVWLLLGVLVLRSGPLTVLSGYVLAVSTIAAVHEGWQNLRAMVGLAVLVLCVGLVVYQSRLQRSGLPVALSESMLAQLRDRLQAQGRVPLLPAPWRSQSAMLTAHGAGYAGDFLIADLRDDRHLEMVLVDVCGKGVSVGPQALQFAGALGGLIGALPPDDLMRAANHFLLRQDSDESFATAAHVLVDLVSGAYTVTSAGHPPALRWAADAEEWQVDNARGTALGVVPDPELHASTGTLGPGEALMFYTDGVIETRGRDLDDGIAWLRDIAAHRVLTRGFDDVARSILRDVPRGDDDRAVLVLERRRE